MLSFAAKNDVASQRCVLDKIDIRSSCFAAFDRFAGLGVRGPFGPRTGNSSGKRPGSSFGCEGSAGSFIGGGTSGRGLPAGSSAGGSVGCPGVAGGISSGSPVTDIFTITSQPCDCRRYPGVNLSS